MKRVLRIALLASIATLGIMAPVSAAQAEPPVQRASVSVGVIPVQSMGALQFGVDSGLFRRNGITVNAVNVYPNPPAALAALASGQVQFAYSPVIPIINAYAKSGVALRVIAPGNGLAAPKDLAKAQTDEALAALLGNASVCANPASGVTSWSTLSGKKVAVLARNQQGEVLIANAVKASGGDPSTITWVEMPFAKVIPALQSGAIDAGFLDEPFTQQCATSNFTNLGNPGVKFFTGSPVIGMWVTTAPFMDQNPQVVAEFQKSIYQAHQAVMTSKKNFAQAVVASTKVTGASVADAKAANDIYFPLRVTRADIANPVDKMRALGYLSSTADIPGLLARQYRP